MNLLAKILTLTVALALVSTTLLLTYAQEKDDGKKEIKVRVNAEIRDDLGMKAEDIKSASHWFFSNHGVEVVDESGNDVIELYVIVGQDDADDDNDGVADREDSDDDGDKIEDSKETDFAVDLDKVEPEVMENFEHKDKQRGVYILFYTAGNKAEHVRGFSEVDSFETEEGTSRLRGGMVLFQTASFSPMPAPTPKPASSGGSSRSVNDQITDSVTQANVKVLGEAPAMAMGNLYLATSQALANAAHNATRSQQQTTVTAQAATTMGVATLYSLDTASVGVKDLFGALGRPL